MTAPTLIFSSASAPAADVDVVVIGARTSDQGAVIIADPAYAGVAEHFTALGVTCAAEQLVRTVDTVG
ncbi:hypothetical protein ACC691_41150, partial [Rhizobium johnstonii]|uniref:hypothetical protein n=1 Tax=Rhizobium johnstonii TaxID=3019933 RepID=UPI003F9CCBEF